MPTPLPISGAPRRDRAQAPRSSARNADPRGAVGLREDFSRWLRARLMAEASALIAAEAVDASGGQATPASGAGGRGPNPSCLDHAPKIDGP